MERKGKKLTRNHDKNPDNKALQDRFAIIPELLNHTPDPIIRRIAEFKNG